MLYMAFPMGTTFGWGICGKYISRELLRLTNMKIICKDLADKLKEDPLSYYALKDNLINPETMDNIAKGHNVMLDGPLLQAIPFVDLKPDIPNIGGTRNFGYIFFEMDKLLEDQLDLARNYYEKIITGSTWCEKTLRKYGFTNLETIIQGVDTQIFNTCNNEKDIFKDKFVIFSGGKFELRKGQDIVLKAFKHLQDKYNDVMLVGSWHNYWPSSIVSMAGSKNIKFPFDISHAEKLINDFNGALRYAIELNGIDLNRVILAPACDNTTMALIYKNTDIGMFPNRCEGGTNLVLMEYMACGKPVIASYNSGHEDILTPENSLRILKMGKVRIQTNINITFDMYNPDVDEATALLEQAYLDWKENNSQKLSAIAKKAGEDLSIFSWANTATKFYNLTK